MPAGDEWIEPVVLFPESGKATNKEDDQVMPEATEPMEVEVDQSYASEHPAHQGYEETPSKKRKQSKESKEDQMQPVDFTKGSAWRKKKQRENKDYRDEERSKDAASKKRKRDNMSPEEKEEHKRKQREYMKEYMKEYRASIKANKIIYPKGYVINEEKDLLTNFNLKEKYAGDKNERDEQYRHYLGAMNVECGYCGGLGFKSEVQGTFPNPENPKGDKLVHFGDLCCCRGSVDGIRDYNLPEDLEWLYESDTSSAEHFRKNARIFNNGMAMCSLTAKGGWRTRANNNTQESMLTANGQLFSEELGPCYQGKVSNQRRFRLTSMGVKKQPSGAC